VTAIEPRLATVLAIAVAVVASAVVAPIAAASTAGAGSASVTATEAPSAPTQEGTHAPDRQRPLVNPTPCSTTPGVVDVTTNATVAGTTVGLTDTSQVVPGAAAATVADAATTTDRWTNQSARLTRRPAGTRALCQTR
jgi:hypothetical protein